MAKVNKENKKTAVIKWVILGLITILIAIGGYFGYRHYEDYQANRVYSIDETVGFSDFDFHVTKAEFKDVDLPLDEAAIAGHGGLDNQEECSSLSTEKSWEYTGFGTEVGMDGWRQNGPSDYEVCSNRNESRNAIAEYAGSNKQLVIDYKVTAKNSVSAENLALTLMPDSGRDPNTKVSELNGNQFLKGGLLSKETETVNGVTHGTYSSLSKSKLNYNPYGKSDIGGDINKGLERTGYVYTDIRNSEKIVDLKVTYKKDGQTHTRIVRITHQ